MHDRRAKLFRGPPQARNLQPTNPEDAAMSEKKSKSPKTQLAPKKPKTNLSQPRTLAKYLSMLKQHEAWSRRNILGIRSFLRRDYLQEPGRWDLLQEFLRVANAGEVRIEPEQH